MRIGGIQKMTLIDFPGKIATTVFTVGCSFRCGFCHNPELVLAEQFPEPNEMEKEFFEHLQKRQGKLEGVCITGGEPTIQTDIVKFIRKIKFMGYAVKLDSNGTQPAVLQKLLDEKLLDYIAMDIKHTPDRYDSATGVNFDIEKVKKSVRIIMESGVDYEFRTTVVPGLHSEEDFLKIADWIRGAKVYYLQSYREVRILDENLKKITEGKKIDLKKIEKNIAGNFEKFGIRENK